MCTGGVGCGEGRSDRVVDEAPLGEHHHVGCEDERRRDCFEGGSAGNSEREVFVGRSVSGVAEPWEMRIGLIGGSLRVERSRTLG